MYKRQIQSVPKTAVCYGNLRLYEKEQLIDRLIDQPRTYGHLVLPDLDTLAEVSNHRFPVLFMKPLFDDHRIEKKILSLLPV